MNPYSLTYIFGQEPEKQPNLWIFKKCCLRGDFIAIQYKRNTSIRFNSGHIITSIELHLDKDLIYMKDYSNEIWETLILSSLRVI